MRCRQEAPKHTEYNRLRTEARNTKIGGLALLAKEVPCQHAWVLKLTNVQ